MEHAREAKPFTSPPGRPGIPAPRQAALDLVEGVLGGAAEEDGAGLRLHTVLQEYEVVGGRAPPTSEPPWRRGSGRRGWQKKTNPTMQPNQGIIG